MASLGSAQAIGDRDPGRHPTYGSRQERPVPPPPARVTDAVQLSAPRQAALQLLRQRVLACTRALLGLPDHGTVHAFADHDTATVAEFLHRLLSAQNQLAAQRASAWPAERIRTAVADGMANGAAETLEILHDDHRCDAEAIQLVTDALAVFGGMLAAQLGNSS